MKQNKYPPPAILYETSKDGSTTSNIPYIEVPKDGAMPSAIFIFEYKETGEFEPDLKGNPLPIVDQMLHQYVNMELLKEKLSPEINDIVRVAVGMKPLKEAQEKGQQILDKVFSNVAAKEKK